MKHLKNLVLVATSVVLIGVACTKDTTTTTTTVGNWVKRSAFDGNGRAGAACFVINDIAYVGTGYDGTNRYNDLWAFNATSQSWTQKAYMPTAAGKRNSAAAFAIGSKGYVVGGACDANLGYNGKLNDTWEYDATANLWTATPKASLPDPNATIGSGARYGAVGFAIGGKGYVGTG
ncbi:MAG: galactose oxidase, partial [Bacteroidetes bacterium]|nr:galactose oxidase [Bacteroidota bacterium]